MHEPERFLHRVKESSIEMWHGLIDKPASGKKIIATYGDGSGARLFMVTDAGPTPEDGTLLVDQDGDEYGELSSDSYSSWAYLPDDFKLWFEIRSNDF